MGLRQVVEVMEFSAPIVDAKNVTLKELKDEARDQLLEFLHARCWWLRDEPRFRVEHGATPVLYVKANVIKAVRV